MVGAERRPRERRREARGRRPRLAPRSPFGFGVASAPAYESWNFNDDFAPEACEAADTTSDKELFVVSRPATGTTAIVSWNVESAD